MTATLTATETPCSRMSDPTWCIESRLLADVPRYGSDITAPEALVEALKSDTFAERYPYPKAPVIEFRAHDEDDSYLSWYEDAEGLERGAVAGLSCPFPEDGFVEIFIGVYVAPIIAIHEAAHACILSDIDQSHPLGHGDEWREHFRALLEDLYPGAAEAFDRAVSGSEPCTHESIE